jgi:hypothetical protein
MQNPFLPLNEGPCLAIRPPPINLALGMIPYTSLEPSSNMTNILPSLLSCLFVFRMAYWYGAKSGIVISHHEQQPPLSHLPLATYLLQLQEVRLPASTSSLTQKKLKIVEAQEEFGRLNFVSRIKHGPASHKAIRRLTPDCRPFLTQKS